MLLVLILCSLTALFMNFGDPRQSFMRAVSGWIIDTLFFAIVIGIAVSLYRWLVWIFA